MARSAVVSVTCTVVQQFLFVDQTGYYGVSASLIAAAGGLFLAVSFTTAIRPLITGIHPSNT